MIEDVVAAGCGMVRHELGDPPLGLATAMKTLHGVPGLRREDTVATSAELAPDAFGLSAVPADPLLWVEVSAAFTHGDCRPDDGFDVHDSREIRAAKFAEHPVEPFEIGAATPVGDADIYMAREPDAGGDCGADNLWR